MKERKVVTRFEHATCYDLQTFGLQTDTCNKWFFSQKLVKSISKKTMNWGYYFGQLKYFDNE